MLRFVFPRRLRAAPAVEERPDEIRARRIRELAAFLAEIRAPAPCQGVCARDRGLG